MEPRINAFAQGNKALNALQLLGQHANKSSVGLALLELIYYRVSQLNECAFCLDMHSKDLIAKGETAQRIFLVSAWREAPFYSAREKAALAWAESLTVLKSGLVPGDIFSEVKNHFSETEIVDLTMAVIAINSYNRLNIAFGADVGSYVPGQFA